MPTKPDCGRKTITILVCNLIIGSLVIMLLCSRNPQTIQSYVWYLSNNESVPVDIDAGMLSSRASRDAYISRQ